MMKMRPAQKKRSAHLRSWYMPATARDIEPSGPRIGQTWAKDHAPRRNGEREDVEPDRYRHERVEDVLDEERRIIVRVLPRPGGDHRQPAEAEPGQESRLRRDHGEVLGKHRDLLLADLQRKLFEARLELLAVSGDHPAREQHARRRGDAGQVEAKLAPSQAAEQFPAGPQRAGRLSPRRARATRNARRPAAPARSVTLPIASDAHSVAPLSIPARARERGAPFSSRAAAGCGRDLPRHLGGRRAARGLHE